MRSFVNIQRMFFFQHFSIPENDCIRAVFRVSEMKRAIHFLTPEKAERNLLRELYSN